MEATMQEDISTTSGTRSERSSTKPTKSASGNGKWAANKEQTIDKAVDELGVEGLMSRGSDLISSVDFSRATGLVRSYPMQAALGGLVIGFLLGAAVSRRVM